MSLPVSGYVLAGGKSSRMGTDKALLRFLGVPLVELAVAKLQSVCAQVAILSSKVELGPFGELVPDRIAGAGPAGGIDAALAHALEPWILLVPVDVPLLPAGLLGSWAQDVLQDPAAPAVALFVSEGRKQPLISLLRKDLGPFVQAAIQAGERKVLPMLEQAAAACGGLRVNEIESLNPPSWQDEWTPNPRERATRNCWFTNLNTREDFAQVEQSVRAGTDSVATWNR